MLTLFTIPKKFQGPIEVIQRNAIQSWMHLQGQPEIILFGDDEGTAELAGEYGLRYEARIARNQCGTPLVNDVFEKAQRLATHGVLCYVNADIILLGDFMTALEKVIQLNRRFLLVGRRWDIDIKERLDFGPRWEEALRVRVAQNGALHPATGIDYFIFPRGLWGRLPPFAIGRTAWDNWLLYRARARGAYLIDATQRVTAVHQDHDYAHVPNGAEGAWKGPEARKNQKLAGGYEHIFTLLDANWLLTSEGMIPAVTPEHRRRARETRLLLNYPPLYAFQKRFQRLSPRYTFNKRFPRLSRLLLRLTTALGRPVRRLLG